MAVWLCARLSLRHVLLCYNVMLLCVECICFGSVRFAHSLICQSTTFRMCVVFFFNQLCTRLLLWGTYVSSVSNTKYVVTIYKLNFFSSCGISKSNKTRTFVTAMECGIYLIGLNLICLELFFFSFPFLTYREQPLNDLGKFFLSYMHFNDTQWLLRFSFKRNRGELDNHKKNNVYTLNLMSLLQSIHRGPIYNIGLVWWMFQFTFISNTSKCAAHIVVSHHNRHSKTQWRKIWIDIFYLAANVEISIELTGTD